MGTANRVLSGLYRLCFRLVRLLPAVSSCIPNRLTTVTTLFCALCAFTRLAAQGQSLVNFNNRVLGSVNAPVYGVDSHFIFTQVRGDPGLFSGPLVSGSGHTAGLWAGPPGSAEDALVLLGTTTFQSNELAGFVVPVQLPSSFLPGQRVTFQVRAWDNQAGTVTSWEQARTGNFGAYGSSAIFSPADALGANPLSLVGLQSFNVVGPKSLTNFVADCASARRNTIAWFGSPPVFIGLAVTTLDLDRDTVSDISVWANRPQNLSEWTSVPFYVSALGTNSLLAEGSEVFLRPAGFLISSVTSSNAAWSNAGQPLHLTTSWSSISISGWTPPLGLWDEGYAGVRFHAADGWHYGWLRFRLDPWPAVTEWAYETRPDVPICAGAKPVVVPLAMPQVVRAAHLRLHWPSVIGRAYQVQFKDRLDAPTWTNLGFVVIATATNAVVDLPLIGSTRFFRIVEAD